MKREGLLSSPSSVVSKCIIRTSFKPNRNVCIIKNSTNIYTYACVCMLFPILK